MNKITILIFTFLLSILGAQVVTAQDATTRSKGKNEYGFRIGLNYSDLDFTEESIVPGGSQDPRIGFMAGFFAVFPITYAISIQPEIQFSAQGEKFSTVSDSNGIVGEFDNDELSVNLIQIPIFLNYTIANKFVLSVGPQLGLNVWEWERQSDYQPIQLSGVAGVAYKFTDNVSVALRGSLGLTDAVDADNSGSFQVINDQLMEPVFIANAKNHYLQLSVSYQL